MWLIFDNYTLSTSSNFLKQFSTGSTKSLTATFLPTSTNVLFSNKTVSYSVATEDSSICTHKLSDTTVDNFPNNNNLLDNNVFVGFFGIFVLFFVVFVVVFIYFILSRKKPNSNRVKEREWQAPYQSLHLETVGIHSASYPESLEQSNAESAYLSPVFNQNESVSSNDVQEHGIMHGLNVVSEELDLSRQRFIHDDHMYAENELNISLTNQTDHVYIEIAEGNDENLYFSDDYGRESNNNDSRNPEVRPAL